MARASSSAVSTERYLDYSFGFDNVNFSDRILLLEIVDNIEAEPNPDAQIVDNEPGPDGKVVDNAIEVRCSVCSSTATIITTTGEDYTHQLFDFSSDESVFPQIVFEWHEGVWRRHVSLRIEASEEVSFMDLLNYIYSNNLPTTLFALLDLLETTDKFEVASCLRESSRSMQKLPMTYESASHYLDLPQSLLMSPTVQPLINAAKEFLVAYFKDLDRSNEEVLTLPLAGIQAVLSSDNLRVASEGVVYELVLKWARTHYSNLEERREILITHLLHLIRFPFMSTRKLIKEVLTCSDIDPEFSSKIVFHTLHFEAEHPHRQRCLAAVEGNAASRQFVERAYTFRPVNAVEFELPHRQCTVYLDLQWEEVARILHDGQMWSESSHFGGQDFVLIGRCFLDKQTRVRRFWQFLVMRPRVSAAYTVNYEVALRMKPLEEFVNLTRGSHTFEGTRSSKNLVGVPCTDDDELH